MPGVTVSLCPVMDDFGAYEHRLDGGRMWAVPMDVAVTDRDGRYALEGAAGIRGVVDLRDAGGRRPPYLPGAISGARYLEDQGFLGNLWPGEWTLEIREIGGRTWGANFTIRAGETVDVALQ